MTEIEKSFEGYIKACYPNTELPDWQKQDLARCFFSGCLTGHIETLNAKSLKDTVEIYENLKRLLQSLTNRN